MGPFKLEEDTMCKAYQSIIQVITQGNDDILVEDGFDWLNETYDGLVEKHREKEIEIVARRFQPQGWQRPGK